MKEKLQGCKTYIASAIGAATAFLGWLNGEIALWPMLLAVAGALGLSALRAGVKKSGP